MKKILVGITATLLLGVVLTACSDQTAAPVETSRPEPVDSPTDSPQPVATDTLEPAGSPEPTNTALPTATLPPTATPTDRPTPEVQYNLPGFYPLGGCTSYQVDVKNAKIEFCVISITIKNNGHMVFLVSWTPKFGGGGTIIKFSDTQNPRMNIRDNLGNKYHHVGVWGRGRGDTQVESGQTIKGFFEFPKALPGATSFTFFDDDNDVSIGPFKFDVAPIILLELLELNWYPQSMEFPVEIWEVAESDSGGSQLNHLSIGNCSLIEWEPSDVEGKYKNTIEIGGLTFEIYGWNEADWSVREYVAVAGLYAGEPEFTPLFRVRIPYDESLQCIFDASTVLGTLWVYEQ